MKICPVGAELLKKDGRKGGYDEDNGCFSQFCEQA
jgi:hypothetical protein